MTDFDPQRPVDPIDPTEPLGRFRDGFGRDLVAAQVARERRVPRRRLVLAMATATAVAIVAAFAVSLPGGNDSPVPLGVSPAEAAVRSLTQSLRSGVLIREWTTTTHFPEGPSRTPVTQRSQLKDWTDLATRQEHARGDGGFGSYEYWNPSAHERYSVDQRLRARDGRPVITYYADQGSANGSSSGSPIEEVQRLQASAKKGQLSIRHAQLDGQPVVVLEQRQKCFSTPDGGTGECPASSKRWPAGSPKGMRPVINFQTWWLSDGGAPRMLREDNGFITPKDGKRTTMYSAVYGRWEIVPATESSLALVLPPPPSSPDYLLLKGRAAFAQALASGEVVRVPSKRPTP